MNHNVALSFVIALMFVLVAIRDVHDRHQKCISCGRRFEHAPECPVVRSK